MVTACLRPVTSRYTIFGHRLSGQNETTWITWQARGPEILSNLSDVIELARANIE